MSTLNRRNFFRVSAGSLFLMEQIRTLGTPLAGWPAQLDTEVSKDNPFREAISRLRAMVRLPLTSWRAHPDNLPHPEDPTLGDAGWKPIKVRERWNDGPVWFRRWVEIPKALGGYDIQGKPLRLDLRLRFEGYGRVRVFFNGSMTEMTLQETQQPILLTASARPGERFLVAAYAPATQGPAGIQHARLEVDYPPQPANPRSLLEQILSVQAASKGFPEGQGERDRQLAAAVRTIDFGALDRGSQRAFNTSLAEADGKMQPLAEWIKQFSILAVGNAHIDLAWLWPWTETVEVVRDTFGTALELMDQYPKFTFAQSTAQDFLWLEEKYPDIFKRIQQRVKEGRWEMVGGMWCEPDLNIPCGESLVRQLLTGKLYFQKKFGVDVRIGWNPDSFGYSWQLPQIYKRAGVDYFVTQKMAWNDTTKIPYKLFWWESPDGSRVLTYFPHDYVNPIDPVEESRYIAEDTPLCAGYKTQMLLYGVGDHGGGPTRTMLDAAERWLKSPQAAFANFEFSTAQDFFDGVEKSLANSTLKLPEWKTELYFQYHRGTYTTQANSKKRMREREQLLLNSERFASLAMLHGRKYPQGKLEDCWRRVLFNQFHDLMAGSGIRVIYVDEKESMEFVKDAATPVLEGSMATLAARIDTRGPGRPVVVFNPLSWERTDVAEAEVQFPGPAAQIEVQDSSGGVVPSAVISRDHATHQVKVRFLARGLPAVGYKVFHVVSAQKPRAAASFLKAKGLVLENEFLRVKIDSQTGCFTALVNKKDGRNILRPGTNGNLLEAFTDKPKQWDAWNIQPDYDKSKKELLDAEEVKLVEDTPVRAVVRVKKHFQNSSFVQDICLYPEVPRVDVTMQAEWHEQHVMLKVAFPVDVKTDHATYEVPYGTIERPAVFHTPAEKAEFEVPAQRWGDLSDARRGFSLLNACKYGYDTLEAMVIRLTLLRSPLWPDPHADQGFHEFTYALYPHTGGWREGETERRGYELNFRSLPVVAEAHEGLLPPSHSFAGIEPANVILTAVKKAEEDDGLVFRFYEFEGKPAQVHLTLPQAALRAEETNLLEKKIQSLPLEGNGKEITLPVKPYEIRSVKVRFKTLIST